MRHKADECGLSVAIGPTARQYPLDLDNPHQHRLRAALGRRPLLGALDEAQTPVTYTQPRLAAGGHQPTDVAVASVGVALDSQDHPLCYLLIESP